MNLFRFTPKKNTAQAMVEFAIVLPLLLLLLYGLLEAGRLLFIYSTIVTASRQAARYGSATGQGGDYTTEGGPNNSTLARYQDCYGIRRAAERVDFLDAFQDDDIVITYDDGPGTAGVNPSTDPPTVPPWKDICDGTGDVNVTLTGNSSRIVVTIRGDYTPIVPKIVPFLARTVANGNPIRAISARTILTGVPIEVTPPPGSGPGPSPTGLLISMTANPTTYSSVNQEIVLTFTLTNNSNPSVTLYGPFTITYSFGSATCTGDIAPGASITCTASYFTTAADVAAGTPIIITAHANSGTVDSANDATVTIQFAPQPSITLAKIASPAESSTVGQPITYTFTVTNNGNVAVTGVSVSDPLVGGAVSGCAADLAVGAQTQCNGTYTLKNNDVNENGPKTLVNNATASATFNSQSASANASATVYTGGLSLSASASPTSVSQVGQVISYTYVLRNNTNHDLTAPFTVSDSFVANETCAQTPNPLPAGGTVTCSGSYTVTQADLDAGNDLVSNISGTAVNGPKTSVSNSATIRISVVTNPALSMQLTAAPNPATTLGTVLTYSYTVTNTGNVTLSTVGITDNKITGITCPASLAPGAVQNCTASYTVTQADLDAGSIINQATATAIFKSNPVSSAPQSLTVLTYVGPRLGIRITPNPTTFTGVGQFIIYTYTITNTGSEVLYGPYRVDDTKVSFVDCSTAAPSLAVGASTMCVGTYATTQADLDANYINTSATATGSNGTQPVPSTAATASVKTPWAPTPTATPVPVCNNFTILNNPPGIAIPGASGNSSMSMTFTNPNPYSVSVSSVQVTWNNTGGSGNSTLTLQTASLNGTQFFTGSDSSGNLTIPVNSPLAIPGNNAQSTITFTFNRNYQNRGNPSITINLSTNGCQGSAIHYP